MAGDVKVAVVAGTIPVTAAPTKDFTKSGFGAPKACIVIASRDQIDDASAQSESVTSIGFSDFSSDYCITHQDEDNSAKVDCDALKSNTSCYNHLNISASVESAGTASTITDGVRLTGSTNQTVSWRVTVIMFGGADLGVSLQRTAIASSQNSTATISHSGEVDTNDKLIFFIGTDISGEDSANSGINNSFGVCHATGSDGGGWVFVQRALGWASDHNAGEGAPRLILSTNRVLDIITEAGAQDWGLEVTALDHSPAQWTVTTRDNGAGAGMEVYSLALDLDDRKGKVFSVDGPTSGATWSITGMGFKPQYVGLGLTRLQNENVINAGVAGSIGISSNTGSGEETCHSFYNENIADPTNTNNLFRGRVIDLRTDDVATVSQDHSHSSFDSGGVTHTINAENETAVSKWMGWAIEEPPAAGETLTAVAGSYALTGVAANTLWKHEVDAVAGSYALTGVAAGTAKGFKTTAVAGAYTYTGVAALFPRTHVIAAAQGAYTYAGVAANTLWKHLITAVAGTYAHTGVAAILSRAVTITADQGIYTLTGVAADTFWAHLIGAVSGSYALTGIAADTRKGSTMVATAGSYALTGVAADLLWVHLIPAAQGTYALTGYAAITAEGFRVITVTGAYTLTGVAVTFPRTHVLATVAGSYTQTGVAATLSRTYLTAADQGSYTLTGIAVDLLWTHISPATVGSYTLTGYAATTTFTPAGATTMVADQGGYTYTGYAAVTEFAGLAAVSWLIPRGRRRRRS